MQQGVYLHGAGEIGRAEGSHCIWRYVQLMLMRPLADLQKPHFLERASVVMVDHESGLTRAPTDNLEHHSLEFKDTHDKK